MSAFKPRLLILLGTTLLASPTAFIQGDELPIADAVAATADEMKAYAELIEHTDVNIELVPIPGGEFLMGSPADEENRENDEGPVRKVNVAPFWMGKHEITWSQYEIWGENIDMTRRKIFGTAATPRDPIADAVTRPTPPYTDMSFGMGKNSHPAISMTQHAARKYCKWLSAKTGRYYRLPTEAEWEYACRAGTDTAFSFGNDKTALGEYAWYGGNTDDNYKPVGQKKPNPWGLYDMHGNVSEWTLDQHSVDGYEPSEGVVQNPLRVPMTLYPRVVRGGGWDDSGDDLRSANRMASDEDWKQQDPQEPRSIWYHTDALSIGFRIVRPLKMPSAQERQSKWDKTEPIQLDPVDD